MGLNKAKKRCLYEFISSTAEGDEDDR
jgi:hypothetical protein